VEEGGYVPLDTRARQASCRVHTLAVAGSSLHYLSGRFSVLKMPGVELEYNIVLLEDMYCTI
jgi:hypothetical protein